MTAVKESSKDYCFYPIRNVSLYKLYQTQQAALWNPQGIEFFSDREQWESLDENIKAFIKQILGFFACADGIVNENIMKNFIKDTSGIKEAGFFYAVQSYIETVHAETYSMFIDIFFKNIDEKEALFDSLTTMPYVTEVANWIFKWMDRSASLSSRIVAFACVEGIFFCSAFAAIYWIKSKNILPGLTKANEWIARDEQIHVDFAIELYKIITSGCSTLTSPKLSETQFKEIIISAVNIAEEFTRKSLRVDLVNLTCKGFIEYIKATADIICKRFGYTEIYGQKHSLDWMVAITLTNKSNFFESSVTEYSNTIHQVAFDNIATEF